MKTKFIQAYMDVAARFAQLSSAKRLQVGAIVVKDDRIISIGYNGMPSGWDNCCEEDNKTKPEVIHAESNAISKLARGNESGEGATMFVTHQPCIDCAKLIYQSGIATVYYKNEYRSTQGLDFLNKSDVRIVKV
tara:strand:- start:93 stop:494 length:402 start_codon:yes stop_codon:yes gene_type:complete